MKVRKIQIYLAIILFTLGFLFSYSFAFTQENVEQEQQDQQWIERQKIEARLLKEKESNRQLEKQLQGIQRKVSDLEKQLAKKQKAVQQVHTELEKERMVSGLIPVTGPGVTVILNDSKEASDYQDVTNYIVHEQDVRRVINELLLAGAEAVSINGQRLVSHSSIRCVGPTIIVDGVRSTIPFEINAIGDPETLSNALHMAGGIVDRLRAWTIQVKVTRHNQLELPAYMGDLTYEQAKVLE